MTDGKILPEIADWSLELAVRLCREFPRGALSTTSEALGDLAWDVLNVRREVVLGNLQRAFPDRSTQERERLARNCYRFFVRAVLDWIRMAGMLGNVDVEVRGSGILDRHLNGSGGAVAVTAHLGYWEWAAALLSRRYGGIRVYADRQSVDVFQRFIDRHRRGGGVRAAYGSLGVRHLLRHLQEGKLVGVVGDQRPSSRYEYIKFMNSEVRNMTIFAYLARKTGVPVIPVVAWKLEGNRVRLEIDQPFHASLQEEVRTRDLLREYNAWLEDAIHERPEQYFWLHNRFKHARPIGTTDRDGKAR